jgi:hypothetical protein
VLPLARKKYEGNVTVGTLVQLVPPVALVDIIVAAPFIVTVPAGAVHPPPVIITE